MKRLLLPFFLMGTWLCHAQQPACDIPAPYSDTAYNILKNLDKNQVPTGVLYEYVYPFAEVEFYDGSSTTDTTNFGHFFQAYSELYRSTFNNTGLTHVSTIEDALENFHTNKKYYHPFGVIDYQFNTIHPDAVTNNLLSISNNQLFDVAGRTQSPYVTHTAMMASVLMNEDYPCFFSGQHYLYFSNDYVLTNTGFNLNQVSHLEVIQDGNTIYNNAVSGLENFTLPLTIGNFDQNFTLVVIFTVSGNQKKYIITSCQSSQDATSTCRGHDQIEVTGYPFDGGYGEGLYSEKGIATIYYSDSSCANKKLRKPIIFVDGFDANNKQHYEKIWKEYLNVQFTENNNPAQLGNELLEHGYDIIILDQVKSGKYNRGGAGLIENNGLVLAKLLDTLYALHGSTILQDFVVVGASMGGKVSRFGLAWMEHNNKPHHTRLFVSFDSPQNGANIPIGLQQLVDNFTQFGGLRLIPMVKNALHQSNAAKQMLLFHSSTGSESIQADPFRTIWLNNISAVGGYPTQCRIVSIVNGNRDGVLKPIVLPPNDYDAVPINEKDKEADVGIKRRLLYNCNANVCYKLHAQVYAQTASNRAKTQEFTLNSINPLLYLLAGGGAFLTFTNYTVSANNTSYDIAPGSRLRQDPLAPAENGWIDFITFMVAGKLKISTNNLKHSNFIPTTSSVAYTFPNNEPFSVYKNFTGVNLSRCAGTTPFDTVYAVSADMPHVAINSVIATAFRNEVYNLKSKSVCAGECPEYVNLNTPLPNGSNSVTKASKAICLLPNFKTEIGTVFKAQIGCTNLMSPYIFKKEFLPVSLLTTCNFDWDPPKNEVICGGGFTTFKAFVKNFNLDTYAEFSTNGSTWFRANIGDNGYQITVNANAGQSQQFFARPHNNPTNVIQGFLAHCN